MYSLLLVQEISKDVQDIEMIKKLEKYARKIDEDIKYELELCEDTFEH